MMELTRYVRLHVVAITLCLSAPSLVSSQAAGAVRNTSSEVERRVESIVQKAAAPVILRGPSSGITISSQQLSIPQDGIEEVKGFGSRAVPALSNFLLKPDARSELVAIRLLGVVGGDEVVDPLLKVRDLAKRNSSVCGAGA